MTNKVKFHQVASVSPGFAVDPTYRDGETLRRKFKNMKNTMKPSGDPSIPQDIQRDLKDLLT
jgi:hypothetical protein